ncbi:MAG TPA: ABC transporter permease subunit, partial [Alphaproteobacteria bacterium]
MARAPATGAWWNDRRVRAVLYQLVFLAVLVAAVWLLVSNTIENLRARGLKSGFEFMGARSGIPISDSIIPWDPDDTFGRAYLVGILNTLRVGVVGIILATILGTIIGIARLSQNWIVSKVASFYVETIRNIPLLLQLIFIYALVGNALPEQLDPLVIGGGFYLSKSGLIFPLLKLQSAHYAAGAVFLASIVAVVFYNKWAKRRQYATGVSPKRLLPSLGILFLPALAVFVAMGAPGEFDV